MDKININKLRDPYISGYLFARNFYFVKKVWANIYKKDIDKNLNLKWHKKIRIFLAGINLKGIDYIQSDIKNRYYYG